MLKKKNKEISAALKRFFPGDNVRLIALFVSQKASDLAFIYLPTEFTSRYAVSISVHCTVGPYFNWVVQFLP